MRLIMEPTEHDDQHKVTIEVKSDDLEFDAAIELCRCALLAWGYYPQTVSDFFEGIT